MLSFLIYTFILLFTDQKKIPAFHCFSPENGHFIQYSQLFIYTGIVILVNKLVINLIKNNLVYNLNGMDIPKTVYIFFFF